PRLIVLSVLSTCGVGPFQIFHAATTAASRPPRRIRCTRGTGPEGPPASCFTADARRLGTTASGGLRDGALSFQLPPGRCRPRAQGRARGGSLGRPRADQSTGPDRG